MAIIYPSNTKSVIDEIRNTIGRDITVYITASGYPTGCSICTMDPVTELSTDPFCSGCDGEYWITELSGWEVKAHVRWTNTDQPLHVPGGIIDEGDCRVTITVSGGVYLDRVKNADHFMVDDVDLYQTNYQLKGVPSPNRITVTLKEDAE